jgi:predicted dehydrogenase
VDAVEALLPVALHTRLVVEMLGHGWHVNLQKPMCSDLPSARLMLARRSPMAAFSGLWRTTSSTSLCVA